MAHTDYSKEYRNEQPQAMGNGLFSNYQGSVRQVESYYYKP